jgi:phosphomannomutase / phosphoglucomutase
VAGRLIQLVANGEHTLSELDNQLPRLYSTPEYRPHCPDNEKANVIQSVRDMLAHAGEINDVDGVRVQFSEGWGLLRASNTEPVLSLRFEATTREHALAYRDAFARALAKFPHVESFGDSQPSS